MQCSVSFNAKKGTLRGMHYQAEPYAEAKLVRCTRGAIYDVVVDLRPKSPTFKHWIAVVLTAANRNMVYVPEGCGHGFLTLEDGAEVFYQMSEFYHPRSRPAECGGMIRHSRLFGRSEVEVISERDRTYPNFESDNGLLKELDQKNPAEIGEELHGFAAELTRSAGASPATESGETLAMIKNRIPLTDV